jgi:Lon protease-like protein
VPAPLPLFPLNVVLVPGLVLPLHIFEPRYRGMIDALLGKEDPQEREFGIVAVRDGRSFDRDGPDAVYPIGTATLLREAERLPDGRFDIITTGTRRFRILEVDRSAELAVATVDFLEDVSDPADALIAMRVRRAFDAYRQLLGGQLMVGDAGQAGQDDLPEDPTVLSYLVTAAMVLPWAQRQELLAAPDTATRLHLAATLLQRENGLIATLAAVPAVDALADLGSVN